MEKNNSFKYFALILALVWIASDICLTEKDPLKYSPYIMKNDYEITQLKHPEKVWDKVFFGSSVVVASFIEEESKSGYFNVGVDYGSISDIYDMIVKNKINIGSDLVVALNDISFLDSLDTNPTYLWHKKWYQHYIFFTRDKTYPLIEKGIKNVLDGKAFWNEPEWSKQEKVLYYGNLNDEELNESNKSMLERFGNCTLEDCSMSFYKLNKLIGICEEKNIRLRFVWMPWNPKIPIYDFADNIMAEANKIFEENGTEVFDMTNMIESKYFYDIGHMSYEEGARYFTEKVDEFLCK